MYLTMLFAVACATAAPGGDRPVQNDWTGELQIGDTKVLVELRLDAAARPPAGTIAFPVRGEKPNALSTVSAENGSVTFAWPDEAGEMTFEGRISHGLLAGEVRAGRKTGTL